MDWCSTVFKRPKGMLDKSVDQLLHHYMKTFPGEQALRNEDGRALWNSIVNMWGMRKAIPTTARRCWALLLHKGTVDG